MNDYIILLLTLVGSLMYAIGGIMRINDPAYPDVSTIKSEWGWVIEKFGLLVCASGTVAAIVYILAYLFLK